MNLNSVLDKMATFEIVHDFLEDPSDIPGSSTSFVTDGEISQYAKLSIPKNTMNKYKWASNLFERWYEKRNKCDDESVHVKHMLEEEDDERLSNLLAKFVIEVKPARSEKPFSGEI